MPDTAVANSCLSYTLILVYVEIYRRLERCLMGYYQSAQKAETVAD